MSDDFSSEDDPLAAPPGEQSVPVSDAPIPEVVINSTDLPEGLERQPLPPVDDRALNAWADNIELPPPPPPDLSGLPALPSYFDADAPPLPADGSLLGPEADDPTHPLALRTALSSGAAEKDASDGRIIAQTASDTGGVLGAQLNKAGMERDRYVKNVRSLDETDTAGRTAEKIASRERTPVLVREPLSAIRPSTSGNPGSTASANMTNTGANTLGRVFKYAGRSMLGASLAYDAYDIATSEKPWRTATEAALGLLGGLGGSVGGAVGGSFVAPVAGTIAGGIAGGAAGSMAGRRAGDYIYDHLLAGPSEPARE
jgi:hypothetical protein